MKIYYNSKKIHKNNLFFNIEDTINEPSIILNYDMNELYTLLMFDPNAIIKNKIHWLVINIKNNDIKTGKVLIEYKGPRPPKKTNKHHYVFCLMKQKKYINANEINDNFNDRFIELDDLFKKLNLYKKNKMEIICIKYFVSENI
jgi:hypothetical protein